MGKRGGELKRANDALESHTWALVFGFFAVSMAAAAIFLIFRDSPLMVVLMMAPVVVLIMFMLHAADDWARHRRALHGMKGSKP